jgi:hypothetical protein
MGRALLFLCTGSFVIFGMIQLGVFDRQGSINEMNVNLVETAEARNIANSALERVLFQIVDNPNLRATPEDPILFIYGTSTANVAIVDRNTPGVTIPPSIIEVRSVGIVGESNALAIARLEISGGLPQINGAMGIFTDNLDFNVAGSAFLISGDDKNVDGTDGTMGSLPGIAVNSLDAFNEINSSLNSSQKERVQGEDVGGDASLSYNPDMDGTELEAFIQRAIDNADVTYDNYVASGEGSLGTPEDPKILVFDGILEVKNATGAGIIIIKEGGTLDARGNFDNYQGLIIIQGRADMTRGNINIIGAMLFGGENPSIEIDIDFRGNVHIQYSSQVLSSLGDFLPGAAKRTHRLVSIYD